MKDEIKEILDDLQDELWSKTGCDSYDKLLDYITNLQTIEQQYSAILSENAELQQAKDKLQNDYQEAIDKITNLQEENERLKEKVHNQKVANAYEIVQIDKLQTNIKTQIRRRKKEAQLKRQYKTRIDKAIEYINKSEYATIESYKHIHADEDGRVYNLDVLLNILQGKSDE